jgi:hypothetical protein
MEKIKTRVSEITRVSVDLNVNKDRRGIIDGSHAVSCVAIQYRGRPPKADFSAT